MVRAMINKAWMPLVAAFAAGALPGQQPGQPAPEVEFGKVFNNGPASWEETDGKLILLDFSETW